MPETEKKNKIIRWLAAACVMLALVGALLLLIHEGKSSECVLTVSDVCAEGPESEVIAEVSVSRLGDTVYPAASFVIEFDRTHLELLSVNEGNVIIPSENGGEIPEWAADVEASNRTGSIRIMYLDTTGGAYALDSECVGENAVLFRLRFRIRGTARAGDIYTLNVSDAVFAANDEADSLATVTGTLNAKNGSIVIEG